MIGIETLWLPILLSAVFVFVVSSVNHMLTPLHRKDFDSLPREAEVMDALRGFDLPPGDYYLPNPKDAAEMRSQEHIEKLKRGPVAIMTVLRNGPPAMGASLIQWFCFSLVVGIFCAYVAGHALEIGAHYTSVFRYVGTVAFLGYSLALIQGSIWYKRKWRTTIIFVFDGLIYALVTAGTFGWLWPG